MKTTLLGLLCAASCGGTTPVAPDAPAIATPPPTLTVVPRQTTLARGATLTLDITLTNFVLIDPTKGRVPHLGEGHYHVFRDGNLASYDAAWTPKLDVTSSTAD